MSKCGDKDKFSTVTGSTMSWLHTRNLIDKDTKITNEKGFDQAHAFLNRNAEVKLGKPSKLFSKGVRSGKKGKFAVPNKEVFAELQDIKDRLHSPINTDYITEDKKEFDKKVALLSKNMNVEVILDSNVPTSRVLAKGDERTIAAGRPVIVVNPNQLFKTTAIHEFGHVFIDSFPNGMNNPRLIKALNSLRGTELWTEVESAYSDLSEEMLYKEILTTAIGRQGSEIWDNRLNEFDKEISAWESFKNWFVDFLGRTFGLNRNEVESLVNEMLDRQVNRDLMIGLSDKAQELRAVGAFAATEDGKTIAKGKSSVESVYTQIQARVSSIFEIHNPKQNATKKLAEAERIAKYAERGERTPFQKVTELRDLLKDYEDKNMVLGLAKYTAWSRGQIKAISNRVERLKNNPEDTTAEDLQEIKIYNSAFQLFEDMKTLIIDLNNKGELSDAKKTTFLREISKLNEERDNINRNILAMQRKIYADIMVKNSNKHEVAYQEKYAREWEQTKPAEEKTVYIVRNMTENKDYIQAHALAHYEALAEEAMADIGAIEGLIVDEKNLSSTEIQVISKMMELADMRKIEFMTNRAQYMKAHHDRFMQSHSDSDMEKKYANFLETDKDGNYSLLSEYHPDFNKQYAERTKLAFNTDEQNKVYKDVEVSDTGEYTLDSKQRKLHKFGINQNVVGEFLEYEDSFGNITTMPIKEAIGKNELAIWKTENLQDIGKGENVHLVPVDKWRNERYDNLSATDFVFLKEFHEMIDESEELTEGNNSLIHDVFDSKVYQLPGITRSSMENIMAGNMKALAVDKITDMFKRKSDEFDQAEVKPEDKLFRNVFADVTNKEKMNVPIPFRTRLVGDKQSLDLHSILLMNLEASKNYQEKKAIEAAVLTVADVMGNRLVPDFEGLSMIAKMHMGSGVENLQVNKSKDSLPNDLKKVLDMMENRLYGIKEKSAGELFGTNIQKDVTTYLKYASSVSLAGNWLNSIVNATSGTMSNLIEAISGETYNMSDWAEGKATYWKDIKNIMNDIGSNVETSRTNLMMNFFNVMGSASAMNNKFSEDTKMKSLMTFQSLRILDHGGEHMMQANTMYAVMNSIKVLNEKGEMLDEKGNITKDKKKACTLDKAIDFVKNSNGVVEMKLKDFVKATTFSPLGGGSEKILLETRGLIKKKVIDLYGNYDEELKAAAQREWWGKLLFFLRKWIISSGLRRWRGLATATRDSSTLRDVDKFYSEDLKAKQEGYYVTAIRFVSTMIRSIKAGQVEALSTNFNELSNHEKANLKRLATEVGMITLTLLAYMAAGGFEDEPDEETLMARFLLRRELAELSFFVSPKDAMKTMATPTATVGVLQRNLDLLYQLTSPTEMYESGINKDRYKLDVKFAKATPFRAAFFEKDLEAALRFQQNN